MDRRLTKLSPLTEASFYILLSLTSERHGYGVIKHVEALTDGRVVLAAGTLYGVITTLLRHGLIAMCEEGGTRSKKTYRITASGQTLLTYETKRLEEMIAHAKENLS